MPQRLAAELGTRAEAATSSGQSVKAFRAAVTHFTHNVRRMNYSTAQAMAMPIGSGVTDIIGKGLIVHALPDDYQTQPTGNSGARIACAVIAAR